MKNNKVTQERISDKKAENIIKGRENINECNISLLIRGNGFFYGNIFWRKNDDDIH